MALLVASALAILATLALCWSWRLSLVREAEAITRSLAALDQGKPIWPVPVRARGAFGRLADMVNEVAPRLASRISALELDRQQLRAVLEGMIEGVIVVDMNRRLRFANPSARRLFGLDGSAEGRLLPEVVRSTGVHEAVDATLSASGAFKGEINLEGREMVARLHPKILQVHGSTLPGPPRAAVLVFHDITELRWLERMRQDFVANVSHELKTPLASIKAYTETLLDGAMEDANVAGRFLGQIDEQADRLDDLIRDLLSLARIESQQDVFDFHPLPLVALVQERAASHRDRAEAKSVELHFEATASQSDLVYADEEALRQILDNLIDNAIKYTPSTDGRGRVQVTCRREPGRVAVDVADNGIGIARDEQERIFERFYRVDKARSRALGGTGLGLSIVKHLVQTLDGTIEVSSRLGAGSKFTIMFPIWSGASRGAPGVSEGALHKK
jgi:two-component system phosphate regulon sensor histidine kinase PhoR